MKITKIYFLVFLVALPCLTEAQKTIIIRDSLAAHAEKLNVNMGSLAMGKIKKFSFGEYAIVSSKGMGKTTGSSDANIFGTKTESSSSKKFTFVLNNKTNDSANVDAGAYHTMKQSLRKIELGNGWSLGNDNTMESGNFTALITINRDTSETWVLFMGVTSRNGSGNYQAILSNGKRKVLLTLASSNKNIQNSGAMSAIGYEFFENDQSLCALQYYGFGKSANMVWLDTRLDAKMKHALAAAMASILLVNSPLSPIY